MLRPKCLHSRQSITAKVRVGKMMNLFKSAQSVCVRAPEPCETRRLARAVEGRGAVVVDACLIGDIFLRLKFTWKKQDLIKCVG